MFTHFFVKLILSRLSRSVLSRAALPIQIVMLITYICVKLLDHKRVFPGGRKRPGRDADPSPPSSAEV
jgi:hypothetical protein